MKKLFVSLLFVLTTILCVAQNTKLPANVTLKALDGSTVSSSTFQNGDKPFIISFWATWCHPCNRELNTIKDVYEEWQEETGVKIFAVSIDQAQNINKVRPLVDNSGWEYDVLLDPNSDLRQALGIQMIPFVLVCDGEGNIVYRHQGYTDGAEIELIEQVRELVKH